MERWPAPQPFCFLHTLQLGEGGGGSRDPAGPEARGRKGDGNAHGRQSEARGGGAVLGSAQLVVHEWKGRSSGARPGGVRRERFPGAREGEGAALGSAPSEVRGEGG